MTLLSGFSAATADAFSKQESKYMTTIHLSWVREAYALPFMLPFLFFIEIPEVDAVFWWAILACVVMDLFTTMLYMKAIKIAPLSLTIPYMGLTPVFSLLISYLVLGETVSWLGLLGILFISFGAYILQIDRAKYGLMEPIKAIFRNKGSLFMLIVSFSYAITANLGKIAIIHSSPMFMAIIYFSGLALAFTPLVMTVGKTPPSKMFSRSFGKFKIGIAMAVMAITHFTAISMINVAYMISIKRLSLLFAILYGWIIFKEQNIKERLFGGMIIIAGAAIIAFA
ncbi:MAG: DMT family transporter [Candidatus Marinimicrobia bacterium]|nr:DMT family transporter [Candidatus Neomarinimicrobiota bacterium]